MSAGQRHKRVREYRMRSACLVEGAVVRRAVLRQRGAEREGKLVVGLPRERASAVQVAHASARVTRLQRVDVHVHVDG